MIAEQGQKIDEMPAGPELDRLVAEEVMGWTSVQLSMQAPPFNWPNFGKSPDGSMKCLRRYSTDISAAWEVVEKTGLLHDDKQNFVLWQDESGWWVISDNKFIAIAAGETATLAICRAALKVKRAEKERVKRMIEREGDHEVGAGL